MGGGENLSHPFLAAPLAAPAPALCFASFVLPLVSSRQAAQGFPLNPPFLPCRVGVWLGRRVSWQGLELRRDLPRKGQPPSQLCQISSASTEIPRKARPSEFNYSLSDADCGLCRLRRPCLRSCLLPPAIRRNNLDGCQNLGGGKSSFGFQSMLPPLPPPPEFWLSGGFSVDIDSLAWIHSVYHSAEMY